MSNADDDALRDRIARLMEKGLKTQTEPFPEDNHQFENILVELRGLNEDNLEEKLVISGFVDHPYGPDEQRCLEL